jgi:ABC-type phosphate transport system substrate-binding protein
MTEKPKKNQINNPNEDPNQLSDEQLDAVAGGGIGDWVEKGIDKAKEIYDDAKEGYEQIKKIF